MKHQVLARWKVEFVQRAPEIFATNPSSEEQERIGELECMVGRLPMELGAAKECSPYIVWAAS